MLSACRQLKSPFYINECLTPTRNKIFYIIRQVKKKHSARVRSIRTVDGSIAVYLAFPGRATADVIHASQLRKYTVNTRRQLMKFLEDELKTD